MNTRGRVAVFQGVLTVAAEHQPIGVQVVEWVGLVASGFQFLLGLAAVFAEEVCGFTFGIIQGCLLHQTT